VCRWQINAYTCIIKWTGEVFPGKTKQGKCHQGVRMKKLLLLIVALMLVVSGCEYNEPLSENQGITIDEAIIGLWFADNDKNDTRIQREYILVLKLSSTEYLIQYNTGSDSMYFRAYQIKIGDTSCLQLQLLGYTGGPISNTDPAYHVANYTLSKDKNEVTVTTLNTQFVYRGLGGKAEMKEAFLKNQTKENLFKDPGKFVRAKKS
jgi:hypothetical protein